MVEFLDVPTGADEVFGLDFAGAHLAVFGGAFDVGDEFLFLGFEFGALAVELALGFFEGALVLAEALLGGLAFAEGPFYYLGGGVISGKMDGGEDSLRSWWMGWALSARGENEGVRRGGELDDRQTDG